MDMPLQYLTAYPRRCGEHLPGPTGSQAKRGLPPQVRGARPLDFPTRSRGGLTPAGAGSTQPPGRSSCQHSGLPPQVRGAHRHTATARREGGLTPAGAGSTVRDGFGERVEWAYPRRCGEHYCHPVVTLGVGGLPPQVRGAQWHTYPTAYHNGLTPAGAGSTVLRSCQTRSGRAYPRRCGEH